MSAAGSNTGQPGSDGIARDLAAVLAADPDDTVWARICALAPDLDPAGLRQVGARLAGWPAHLRTMPDDWWRDRAAGRHRPWHALAACRLLADNDVNIALTVAACTADLGLLLVCDGAEWHHNGGDVDLWDTVGAVSNRLLDGVDYHGEAYDALFSPDATFVVAAPVEEMAFGSVRAWSTADAVELWSVDVDDERDGDGDDYPQDEFDMEMVRLAVSADGATVAAGSSRTGRLLVVEAATGRVVHRLQADTTGPVALDATGRLVAHAARGDRVVIRDCTTGGVVTEHEVGLSVHALAFAPDGAALAVTGRTSGEQPVVGRLPVDRPAAPTLVRPDLVGLRSAGWPVAVITERVVWTTSGVRALLSLGSPGTSATVEVVVDGGTGEVLWRESGRCGLAPDGRAVLAEHPEGTMAWFLDHVRPGSGGLPA